MSCKCKEEKRSVALMITCSCGLKRFLPTGLQKGVQFTLVPCPVCGAGFKGKFLGNRIVEDAS